LHGHYRSKHTAKTPTDPSLAVQIMLFARQGALDSREIVYFGDTPLSLGVGPEDVQDLKPLSLR
jgi:hypothetical protein